jgi:selenide, water dikinase
MLYPANMQSPDTVRLSLCSRFGGCASKVGAADLARVLAGVHFPTDPKLLVGLSTSDDAGVYQLTRDLALVQTVDFFTPIVDDAFDFGRIAATNALSDVYAMGGTPVTALNIAAFPIDTLDEGILRRILEGGAVVAEAAGVVILGGHTVKDEEPKYGMAVTGTIHPAKIVTNAGARPGDHLLLTKPIGAGILTTARRRDGIPESDLAPVIAEMTRLNAAARDTMLAHNAHAATDVTGFGLLGHAVEMARASHVGVEIDALSVPLFPRVLELIDLDFVPSGTEGNLTHHAEFTSYADHVTGAIRVALSDAMTSGGLLISAEPHEIRKMYLELEPTHTCAVIGRITEDGDGTISVM